MVRRAALMMVVVVSGCVSIPRLAPNPPNGTREDVIIETPVGVGMRAMPNAWKGSPTAVAERFTPIWVQLLNRGDIAYDITFANITLIDEQGRLYAAVPPLEVVRATLGALPPLETGVRVASAGEGDMPLLAQFGFGFGVGDPYGNGLNPNAYGPNQPGYGVDPEAARNIVLSGLREGRLLAKTRAMGFVYFQRAYDAKELHLRLQAQPEIAGQAPLELQANFTIAH
jgi:hypothetical protein